MVTPLLSVATDSSELTGDLDCSGSSSSDDSVGGGGAAPSVVLEQSAVSAARLHLRWGVARSAVTTPPPDTPDGTAGTGPPPTFALPRELASATVVGLVNGALREKQVSSQQHHTLV